MKYRKTDIDNYERYGDDLIYNPINYVPEKDMSKEELKEYKERLERKDNYEIIRNV